MVGIRMLGKMCLYTGLLLCTFCATDVGEVGSSDVAFGFCYHVSARLGISRNNMTQLYSELKFTVSLGGGYWCVPGTLCHCVCGVFLIRYIPSCPRTSIICIYYHRAQHNFIYFSNALQNK
jgi:hypothetical protein